MTGNIQEIHIPLKSIDKNASGIIDTTPGAFSCFCVIIHSFPYERFLHTVQPHTEHASQPSNATHSCILTIKVPSLRQQKH